MSEKQILSINKLEEEVADVKLPAQGGFYQIAVARDLWGGHVQG